MPPSTPLVGSAGVLAHKLVRGFSQDNRERKGLNPVLVSGGIRLNRILHRREGGAQAAHLRQGGMDPQSGQRRSFEGHPPFGALEGFECGAPIGGREEGRKGVEGRLDDASRKCGRLFGLKRGGCSGAQHCRATAEVRPAMCRRAWSRCGPRRTPWPYTYLAGQERDQHRARRASFAAPAPPGAELSRQHRNIWAPAAAFFTSRRPLGALAGPLSLDPLPTRPIDSRPPQHCRRRVPPWGRAKCRLLRKPAPPRCPSRTPGSPRPPDAPGQR